MPELLHHSIKSRSPIKDSSAGLFIKDVIEASKDKIVLIDFWAPWCQPCKNLTPILEKIVHSYDGKILLVKINIDQNQSLAQQLRVQSIPMVYAFFQGKPIDAFSGALPENHIKAFLTKLIQTAFPDQALNLAIKQAQYAYDNNQIELAFNLFEHILAHNHGNVPALFGLIKCYIRQNKLLEAKEKVTQIPEDQAVQPLKQEIETFLSLVEEGQLYEKSSSKITDQMENFYQKALISFAQHDQLAAINDLLNLIQKDKEWENQKARKKLLEIFDALGHNNALTISGRKKLSTLLFA